MAPLNVNQPDGRICPDLLGEEHYIKLFWNNIGKLLYRTRLICFLWIKKSICPFLSLDMFFIGILFQINLQRTY